MCYRHRNEEEEEEMWLKNEKEGVGRFMDLPMTIGFQAYRGSNPLTNGHTLKYLDRLTWETRDLYFYRLILLLNWEFRL